jgi:hypothetical protein
MGYQGQTQRGFGGVVQTPFLGRKWEINIRLSKDCPKGIPFLEIMHLTLDMTYPIGKKCRSREPAYNPAHHAV